MSDRIMVKVEGKGISAEDLVEAISRGEREGKDVDKRFGMKYYSVLPGLTRNLTAVWLVNRRGLSHWMTDGF